METTLIRTNTDFSWRDDAVCAQVDPEVFFPEPGGRTAEAKAICATCEVQKQCLAYALAAGERYGVWGGLTHKELRALREGEPPRQKTSVSRLERDERDRQVITMTVAGNNPIQIADRLGISTRTVSRILKRASSAA